MRSKAAGPHYGFYVRLDEESEKLRRQLQEQLDCNGAELFKMALRKLASGAAATASSTA